MTESFARSILHSCPKCDKVPQIIIVPTNDGRHPYQWHVECPECGDRTGTYTDVASAIKVWNDTHPKEGY